MVPAIKKPPANAGDARDKGFDSWIGRSPGRGHSNPLHSSCLENPHGQRSLVSYSPWGLKESDDRETENSTYVGILDRSKNVQTIITHSIFFLTQY